MKNIVAKIRKFLEPDKKKIILFALLAAIMTLGAVQSMIISQREAGMPGSPVYSVIEGIQFGRSMTYIRAPLEPFIIFSSIVFGGITSVASQDGFYLAISAVYLYFLACFVASSWDLIRSRWKDIPKFFKPGILTFLAFFFLFLYVFTSTESTVICLDGCSDMTWIYLNDPIMLMEKSYQEGLVYLLAMPSIIVYDLLLVVPALIPGEDILQIPIFSYLDSIVGIFYVYLLSSIISHIWKNRRDRTLVLSSIITIGVILIAPAVIRALSDNSTDYYGYSSHKASEILQTCTIYDESLALINACPSVGMEGSWEEMEKLRSSTIDDECLANAALKTWDKTVCNMVVDKTSRAECINEVQDKWDNTPQDSKEYKEAVAKYRCYYDAALEVRDVAICQWLPENKLKKECEKEVIAANLAGRADNGGAEK
jgi:hypothetical protein